MTELFETILTGTSIGLWAFLWAGPLSESGQVFGLLKSWAYNRLPEWLYMPVIGCAKCSAFWWCVVYVFCSRDADFRIPVLAIFTAYYLSENSRHK